MSINFIVNLPTSFENQVDLLSVKLNSMKIRAYAQDIKLNNMPNFLKNYHDCY